MASKIEVEVSNLATPILSVHISDFIEFATNSFVTAAISSHNISPISHEDIRTFISTLSSDVNTLYLSAGAIIIDYTALFNQVSNSLSGYAHLSGANFYGDIYAPNLSGTNTGDQNLSNYTTYSDVTSSILEHNVSELAHQDIRDLISRDNNILSAYAPLSGANFSGNITALNLSGINTGDQDLSSYATLTGVSSDISAHNLTGNSHQDIRDNITNVSNSLSSYALSSDLNNLTDSLSAYALQTFVTSSISSHNVDNTSHIDIRNSIMSLSGVLSGALIDSLSIYRTYHYGRPDIIESPEEWFTVDGAGNITGFNYITGRENVVIPWEINSIPITGISANSFYLTSGYPITNILGTKILNNIGFQAFTYCKQLESISFPAVTAINLESFYGCTNLTSISLPIIQAIPPYAFKKCSALTNIYLPNTNTIYEGAFDGCSGLTSINTPNLTNINDLVFNGCTGLSYINIPSVSAIGWGGFYNCSTLASIDLPSITYIGSNAFAGCTSLISVNFSNSSVPAIGTNIYSGATNVVNYVSNPISSGWEPLFGGMPVVRLPVYADSIKTPSLSSTNIYNTNTIITSSLFATGPISASNLSGINTGDQDLSPYALSADLYTLSGSLSAYALQTFVTSSISEHNVSEFSHDDIRQDIFSLSSEFLSSLELTSSNLTDYITNVSDSLSAYALSSDLNNLSNSLSSYALQTFVTSSISDHNVSNIAHQDIRTLITNSTSGLSGYSTITFTTSSISEHNLSNIAHSGIRLDITTLSNNLTSNYVPYNGAINSVNLSSYNLSANNAYLNTLTLNSSGIILSQSYDTLSNLSLQYKMNDNDTTTTVIDSIGSYNGTSIANTNTKTVSGRINTGLSFNGSSDYITAGDVLDMGTSDMSISVWIKTSVAQRGRILTKQEWGPGGYGLLITNGGTIDAIFGLSYSPQEIFTTGTIFVRDNNWHHVTCVFKRNDKCFLYIDGVLDSSTSIASYSSYNNVTSLPLHIGRHSPSAIEFFNGSIDDVRIYSRALDQADINALYNSASGTEDSLIVAGVTDKKNISLLSNTFTFDSSGIFNGTLRASNLSGTNTGDQDLSNLATYTSVTSSISAHNISELAHQDIRTFATSSISSHNGDPLAHTTIRNSVTNLTNSLSSYATLTGVTNDINSLSSVFLSSLQLTSDNLNTYITNVSDSLSAYTTISSLTANYVPYIGAINSINLGGYNLSATNVYANNIEYISNKTNDLSANISTTLYPTTSAVKTYVDIKDTDLYNTLNGLITTVNNSLSSYEVTANKGQNNGYAPLDSGGKVPLQNLPSTLLKYIGTWNALTNVPTLSSPSLTSYAGNVYVVSTSGTQFGIDFSVGDWAIYNTSGIIEKSDNSDDVKSVNSQTGIVVLTTDNISDTVTHRYTNDSDINRLATTSGNNTGDQNLDHLATYTSVTSSISSHNIANNSHQDIRTLITNSTSGLSSYVLTDTLTSNYVPYSGANKSVNLGTYTLSSANIVNTQSIITSSLFATGPISASNLSGTNTGDQDLSSYATTANLIGLATETFVTSSLSTHNEAPDSHQDIRDLIYSPSSLSGYAQLSGANFFGNIYALNLSGINTGDQELSGYATTSSLSSYATITFVTSSISSIAAPDMSQYAPLSAANFFGAITSPSLCTVNLSSMNIINTASITTSTLVALGNITAANLSGTNTGDQDLSSYATTASVTNLSNSLSSYATLSGSTFNGEIKVPTLSAGSYITTPSLTSTNIVNTNYITTSSLSAVNVYANNIEYIANKTTNLSANLDNTYYPTTSAVKTYVDIKDTDLSNRINTKVDILSGYSIYQSLSSAQVTDHLHFAPITGVGVLPEGTMVYDQDAGTISFGVVNGSIQIGQETFDYYTNLATLSGSPVALVDGDVVSVIGVAGNRQAVTLTDIRNNQNASACIGMVTEGAAPNQKVRVTKIGEVHNLNTNSFTEGLPVYVDTTNPGKLTQTVPLAPNTFIHVGIVVVKSATIGIIDVNIRVSPRMQDLSDIDGVPLSASGQFPVWHQELSAFDFDKNINDYALSSTVNNLSNSLSAYALQTFVTSSVSSHNVNGSAHQDIRNSVTNVSNSLSSYALTTDLEDYKTYSGFENRTDSSISIDGSGVFTLSGASFDVYTNGTGKHTLTGTQTVTVTADQTLSYIYVNSSGVLSIMNTPWNLASGENAPCAIVFKDATSYALTEERHSYERNRAWHNWAHNNIGAMYRSGLTGTFTTTTISVTQGVISDEDIVADTGSTRTATTLWYRNGATGMRMVRNSAVAKGLTAGNILAYDNNSGTLQPITTNRYATNWVYATNDPTEPIYTVISQGDYTSVTNARNALSPTINLSTVEWKLIYRVIYQRTAGTPTGVFVEATDFRTVQTGVPTAAVSTDHASLINRDAASSHPATAISYGVTNVDDALTTLSNTFSAYSTTTFTTSSISEHNISNIAHQDIRTFATSSVTAHNGDSLAHTTIRDSVTNLTNSLSSYATLSGSTFFGPISASNLSGTNTGDQNLAPYSLTSTLTANYVPYTGANQSVNLGTYTLSSTNIVNTQTITTSSLNASGNIRAIGTIIGSNLSGTNTGDQDLSIYALPTKFNSTVTTGTSSLQSIPASSNNSCFWNYCISGNNSLEAGQIMSVWNNSQVNYNIVATNVIGVSPALTLQVSLSSNNILLESVVTSGTWYIKGSKMLL